SRTTSRFPKMTRSTFSTMTCARAAASAWDRDFMVTPGFSHERAYQKIVSAQCCVKRCLTVLVPASQGRAQSAGGVRHSREGGNPCECVGTPGPIAAAPTEPQDRPARELDASAGSAVEESSARSVGRSAFLKSRWPLQEVHRPEPASKHGL